jgi:hypothetical protein
MHLSSKTVGTYQTRIKEKLQLSSGRQLVQRALHWLEEAVPPPAAP